MMSSRHILGREDDIRDETRLSKAEDAAFWPVCSRYQIDLILVRNRFENKMDAKLEGQLVRVVPLVDPV